MVATLVIGLREGLEASLIVGIVAAFLRRRGRTDLLRAVFAGVALAVALCAAGAVALRMASRDLPQRQQEGLETVVGVVAVAMVTYMAVWMRRHSRELKGSLESAASRALASGSGWALVVMAFLAVLREGFETSVFLLAAMNQSTSGGFALGGAVIGIAIAVVLGYGIYTGGVRIDLAKFFRGTGIVLALVAAGLVASALHSAHEAGWLDVGQQPTVDLRAVVGAGTVRSALLTGVLGIQPRPVVAEAVGWAAYLLTVGAYVALPPSWSSALRSRAVSRLSPVRRGRLLRAFLVGSAAALLVGVALVVAGRPPTSPEPGAVPVTRSDRVTVKIRSVSGDTARAHLVLPATWGPSGDLDLTRSGRRTVSGVGTDAYATTTTTVPAGSPTALSRDQLAALDGGRLPLGIAPGTAAIPVGYRQSVTTTVWVEPRTHRVVDVATQTSLAVTARLPLGAVVLTGGPPTVHRLADATVADRAAQVGRALDLLHRRTVLRLSGLLAALLAAALLLLGLALRRLPASVPSPDRASPGRASSDRASSDRASSDRASSDRASPGRDVLADASPDVSLDQGEPA